MQAEEPFALLPLYRRDGTVVAHAKIDPDRLEWANQWRWGLTSGYARRSIRTPDGASVAIYLHRELLSLPPGDRRRTDHRDREPLNNRLSNLRIATHAQNMQNRRAARGSTSAHRGVSWNRKRSKWLAQVKVNGRSHFLGYFTIENDAARAAESFRAEYVPFATT